MSRRQRTGEIEGLPRRTGCPAARAEADPDHDDVRSTAFSASYDAARSDLYAAQAAAVRLGLNCGCQKRALFGSLPMMKSFTCGIGAGDQRDEGGELPRRGGDSVIARARAG